MQPRQPDRPTAVDLAAGPSITSTPGRTLPFANSRFSFGRGRPDPVIDGCSLLQAREHEDAQVGKPAGKMAGTEPPGAHGGEPGQMVVVELADDPWCS